MLKKDIINLKEGLFVINRIEHHVGDIMTIEGLLDNDLVYDAVMMNFINLGQACSRISKELKEENPQIDWRGINGFRNFIAHDYLGLDEGIIWAAIKEKLPELKQQFEKVLINQTND